MLSILRRTIWSASLSLKGRSLSVICGSLERADALHSLAQPSTEQPKARSSSHGDRSSHGVGQPVAVDALFHATIVADSP